MTVITNKFRSHVGIRDSITIEKPIEYVIHYLKDDAGMPVNDGLVNECCLNINESFLYKFDGTFWVPYNINLEMCYLFADSGNVNAGNGHNIPDMMIYQKELDGTFSKRYANDGVMVIVKNKSRNHDTNCLRVYNQPSNDWSAPATGGGGGGGYTKEEIEDIVAALIEDGEAINLTYNDAANSLMISCELAEDGDNTVNKGVSSFSDESFASTAGHVTLEKVDGGEWPVPPAWLPIYDSHYFEETNGNGTFDLVFDKWCWDSPGSSSIQLAPKTGTTWANGFRPTKLDVRFAIQMPPTTIALTILDTGHNVIYQNNDFLMETMPVDLDFSNNLDIGTLVFSPTDGSKIWITEILFLGNTAPLLTTKVWGTSIVEYNILNYTSGVSEETFYFTDWQTNGSPNSAYAGFTKFLFGKAVDITNCTCIVGNMGMSVIQDMSTWTSSNPNSGWNAGTSTFHVEPWDIIITNQLSGYEMREVSFTYTLS